MKQVENILVLIDGEESTRKCAQAIVAALSGKKVKVVTGDEFQGTDMLGADFCFFGCARAAPDSFGYFEKLMGHINLTLRRCAIFSPESDKAELAAGYLVKLIGDSGIKLVGEPFAGANIGEISLWAEKTVNL
jgi:hypothetical protein